MHVLEFAVSLRCMTFHCIAKLMHFIPQLTNDILFTDINVEVFRREDSRGRPYPKDMRKFALTLHLYGPKAYNYASRMLPLPSTRSLSR